MTLRTRFFVWGTLSVFRREGPQQPLKLVDCWGTNESAAVRFPTRDRAIEVMELLVAEDEETTRRLSVTRDTYFRIT